MLGWKIKSCVCLPWCRVDGYVYLLWHTYTQDYQYIGKRAISDAVARTTHALAGQPARMNSTRCRARELS